MTPFTNMARAAARVPDPLGDLAAQRDAYYPERQCPFLCGLDLGRQMDYSAFAAVERTEATENGKKTGRYAVKALHRWQLKTPYDQITADVVKMFAPPSPVGGAPSWPST
jgi:hypothetical protein